MMSSDGLIVWWIQTHLSVVLINSVLNQINFDLIWEIIKKSDALSIDIDCMHITIYFAIAIIYRHLLHLMQL